MAAYEVRLTSSAEKELSSLPKSVVGPIWLRIRELAHEPRPVQSRQLRSAGNAHRLRVRDYRVIYVIDDKQKMVVVKAVSHRKDVYRR